jgi:hypothetical protein
VEIPPEVHYASAASSIDGELVTEALEYDSGRQVSAYSHRSRPRQSCSPATAS